MNLENFVQRALLCALVEAGVTEKLTATIGQLLTLMQQKHRCKAHRAEQPAAQRRSGAAFKAHLTASQRQPCICPLPVKLCCRCGGLHCWPPVAQLSQDLHRRTCQMCTCCHKTLDVHKRPCEGMPCGITHDTNLCKRAYNSPDYDHGQRQKDSSYELMQVSARATCLRFHLVCCRVLWVEEQVLIEKAQRALRLTLCGCISSTH